MTDQIPAEVVQPVKGTVGISFINPTPMWATWIFRVEFFANKAFLLWMSSTNIIHPEQMKGIVGTLAAIDFFVWGIGKSIGVKPPEDVK